MNRTEYSGCFYCGGDVCERPVDREVWWKGQLFLLKAVPTGVCRQCGEKFVLPEVARRIDELLSGGVPPEEYVSVPAYTYSGADSAE